MDFQVEPGATPLDLTEAEGLIPNLATQGELNAAESQNIYRAIIWADANRRIQSDLLNPETLKLLHRKMFDQTWKWAGKYRLTQKSIGVEAFRISTELKNLTEDVKIWIEYKSYTPDEIAVRFHHRLVLIHAFPNGNGRHARLATDLLCRQLDIAPFTWGVNLSVARSEIRSAYISALRLADAHDLESLKKFVRS